MVDKKKNRGRQDYKPSEIERKWPHKRLASSRRLPASRSRGASLRGKQEHNPSLIESKWQHIWREAGIYSPNLDSAKKPFYNLMMFPYPSAEGMHVGNMYAFTGSDIYGRFKRMQGFDVFEPIGLDGFGIHSENYAIKVGRHPKEQAKISEKNFYRQLRATGNGFDWSRKLETYDPEYYKWTQWLFIQLFKAGLAYRGKAKVNWCPSCKTVLADEQVVTRSKIKYQISNISVVPRSDQRKSAREIVNEVSVNVCERCGTEVYKKDLEQWFLKITKYANRLLTNIAKLDWSEKVKIAQRQWIGKSEGARIYFPVILRDPPAGGDREDPIGISLPTSRDRNDNQHKIEVFTTRPDTLYGATFLVLSPEHPIVASLLSANLKAQSAKLAEIERYVEESRKKTEQERIAEGKEKTGIFSRLYAINPVNNEKISVWIADYVLMGYGTGAIMGVPAHDQRDFEFAKKYKLPIREVIIPTKKSAFADGLVSQTDLLNDRLDNLEKNITQNAEFVKGVDLPGVEPGRPGLSSRSSKPAKPTPTTAYTSFGTLVNSGKYTGLSSQEATQKIIKDFESRGVIKKEVSYHLRDWLISRQRYWGPPIPMVYCKKCKWQPVAEKDLPVLLPDVRDWKPRGTGKSPLANIDEFVNTTCPNCKGSAKRETDVSDTFLDSSWYFLRYLATDMTYLPFPIQEDIRILGYKDTGRKKENAPNILVSQYPSISHRLRWLPVKMYIGGAEHSVLHLFYARFITMVLYDLGLISFEEPFSRFFAHGLLIKERAKMSKSRGNVVVPDEYIRKYGADALRCYLMFLGPFSQGGDFYDTGIEGMHRFIKRVWRLINQFQISNFKFQISDERKRIMNKTIKKVTEDIKGLKYNTAIAALMEWYNYISKIKYQISKIEAENFLKLLAPFAPHMTEELWQTVKVPKDRKVSNVSNGERSPSDTFGTSGTFDTSFSIHLQPWPTYDPKFLQEDDVMIVVQVNGKVRDTMEVQSSKFKVKSYIEELARKSKRVGKYLEGKEIKKVVYVEGKIINFVTE